MGLPLLVVLLALLFSFSAYLLLNTSSGESWLWSRVEGLESVDIRSSRVSGDLASGFIVQDLEYRSANLDVLVRQAEIEAGFAWWPLAIQVDRMSLMKVEILTRSSDAHGLDDHGDVYIRDTLMGIELPLPLKSNDVVLTGISLQQDDNPQQVLAESVRFKAVLDKRLLIDNLDILATGFEAKLQGYLQFEPPFELAATLEGRFEKPMESGQKALEVPFELEGSGDLDKVQLQLTSQKFGLQLVGDILEPVSGPEWNVQATLDRFQWPQAQVEQGVTLSGLNLESQGTIGSWSFLLDSDLDSAQLQDVRFALSGSGSSSQVDINEAVLKGPGLDLGFSGTLDWSGQPGASIKAVSRQRDLTPSLTDWPQGEILEGDLQLNWTRNGREIPASRLTVTGTGSMVDLEADIDIESNSVDGRLGWSNLRWPLKSLTPRFSSESGQLNIYGTVDAWFAEGSLAVQIGEYPQCQFEIQGGGNRTSSNVLVPIGKILGGSVSGKAEADWSTGVNWSAAILTEGVDPEP